MELLSFFLIVSSDVSERDLSVDTASLSTFVRMRVLQETGDISASSLYAGS